jgi:hypothetical protein
MRGHRCGYLGRRGYLVHLPAQLPPATYQTLGVNRIRWKDLGLRVLSLAVFTASPFRGRQKFD